MTTRFVPNAQMQPPWSVAVLLMKSEPDGTSSNFRLSINMQPPNLARLSRKTGGPWKSKASVLPTRSPPPPLPPLEGTWLSRKRAPAPMVTLTWQPSMRPPAWSLAVLFWSRRLAPILTDESTLLKRRAPDVAALLDWKVASLERER